MAILVNPPHPPAFAIRSMKPACRRPDL